MSNSPSSPDHHSFEALKQTDAQGNERWYARALAKALGYSDFRNFTKVIDKAKIACEVSGYEVLDHAVELNEMIQTGKGAARELPSYSLSRYACYLIVQNGDPSKPVIAAGQTYFAIQARRQELQNDSNFGQLKEDEKRLLLRNELKEHNKQLVEAAAQAGVDTHETHFTMERFTGSVNKFLAFNEYKVLEGYGGISGKQAEQKAFLEDEKFNKTQKIESDFDKKTKAILNENKKRVILMNSHTGLSELRGDRVQLQSELKSSEIKMGGGFSLVPMFPRGNPYLARLLYSCMHYHAGAWEREKVEGDLKGLGYGA